MGTCISVTVPASGAESRLDLDGALNTPEWLSLSGSHRTRFETLHNQLRATLGGGDQLLAVKTSLRADVDLGAVDLVGELWDARGYLGDDGGSLNTGSINALEPVQAHLRYRTSDFLAPGTSTEVLAGRFTMDVGSRRLIGRQRFRNSTNAFTGFKVSWDQPEHQTLTLFLTYPQIRQPADQSSLLDNEVELDDEDADLVFWGAHYQSQQLLPDVQSEIYLYALDEEDDPGERETRNREIVTVGGRLFRKPAARAFDFELEGALQTGDARATSSPTDITDLDVDAYFVHAEIGYSLDTAWSPRLSLEYDLASGDDNPADGDYGRFDQLFGPTRFDLGPTAIWSLLSRANLSSPGIRLEATPQPGSRLAVAWRWVRLAEARDSFGNTGVVDRAGNSGKDAGRQLELFYRRWLVPDTVQLELGATAFFTGDFFDRAPNANGNTDSAYGYTSLTVLF